MAVFWTSYYHHIKIVLLIQLFLTSSTTNGQVPILGVPLGARNREQQENQWKTIQRNESAVSAQSKFRMTAFVEPNDGETNYEQSRSFHHWIEETLSRYDNRLRPFFGTKLLHIQLGLQLMAISSISENTMEFTAEMFFYETWRDPRLRFDPARFGNVNLLTLPLGAPQTFWIPDTTFLNALRSQAPSPGSASHLYYMRLSSNGTIYYSRRLSITAECQFDLTMYASGEVKVARYPFDQQACRLELSSYGWTLDDIVYEWALQPDSIPIKQMELADFYVRSYTAKVVNKTFASGTFSVPQLCFVFTRRWGFCLLNLFIPATAVVGSSWISLWLQKETQFADMVSVILAIVFLACSYNTILPRVSYVKATDIYLAACFIFAFLSLVKLAVVKYMHNLTMERKERMQEAASTNLLSALTNEHISMLAAHAVDNKNSTDCREGSGGGGETCSLRTTNEMPELPRANRLQSASSSNLQRIAIAGGSGHGDRSDRLRRCMHLFHVGSQLILPVAFGSFGIFYFLIYPNVPSKGVCT